MKNLVIKFLNLESSDIQNINVFIVCFIYLTFFHICKCFLHK